MKPPGPARAVTWPRCWDGSNAQRVIFWRPSGHVITRYVTAARSVIRRITLPRHSAAWQRTGEQGTPPPAAMAEEWAYALVVLAADKGKEPTCNSVRRGGGAFGARARWTTSSDVAAARYNAVMDSARLRHVITRYVFSAARSSHPSQGVAVEVVRAGGGGCVGEEARRIPIARVTL